MTDDARHDIEIKQAVEESVEEVDADVEVGEWVSVSELADLIRAGQEVYGGRDD